MKNFTLPILSSFTIILGTVACSIQKPMNSNISLNLNLEKIELTEQTRGTNIIYIFTPKEKITSVNGNQSSLPMNISEWENINKEISQIELSAIKDFESPTTKRYSDAALSSTIIITANNQQYNSASFDAGFPNQKLKPLYDLLKGSSKTVRPSLQIQK